MFKKVAVVAVSVVLLVLIGGLIYLNTNLNAIVKSAIEKYGSQITQTDVTVRDVDVSLSTGKGEVSGFHLGNPKSFVAARAMDIGSVTLQIDKNSVMGSGPLIIDTINVNAPKILYEVNAVGNANLQELQKNISAASPKSDGSEKTSRKVIIKNLYINDGEITVSHALLKGEDIKTDLPPIHLKNIGENGSGVTPQQVAKVVLGEVVRQAAKSGQAKVARELIEKKLGDSAGKAEDSVKNAVGKLFGE